MNTRLAGLAAALVVVLCTASDCSDDGSGVIDPCKQTSTSGGPQPCQTATAEGVSDGA